MTDYIRNSLTARMCLDPDLQVLRSVVIPDSILVMYVFVWVQRTADHLFHDVPVFENVLSVDSDLGVPVDVCTAPFPIPVFRSSSSGAFTLDAATTDGSPIGKSIDRFHHDATAITTTPPQTNLTTNMAFETDVLDDEQPSKPPTDYIMERWRISALRAMALAAALGIAAR
jgi:hypothetical protein